MKKNVSSGVITLIAVLVVAATIGIWAMNTYNGFVTLRTDTQGGWAQVETQYQRRADLVPQLVAVVEGAADFEKSVLVDVTEARTNWLNTAADPNATIDDNIQASSSFDSAFSRLLVTVEAYPTLTATEAFITLQSQLEGTENRVAVARQDYNDLVRVYNTAIELVPASMVAGMFDFDAFPFFESKDGAEDAPEVEFEFGE